MQGHAYDAADHRQIPNPFQGAFPEPHRPGDLRISRQPAIQLGMLGIVQNVDHVCATDSLRIVNSCILESGVGTKLRGTSLGQFLHL
jgi:hypothetical protein